MSTIKHGGKGASMRRLTRVQKVWCKNYEHATTFDPLMDDYIAGNVTFVAAAKRSIKWFEDWSSDALLACSGHIPGDGT